VDNYIIVIIPEVLPKKRVKKNWNRESLDADEINCQLEFSVTLAAVK